MWTAAVLAMSTAGTADRSTLDAKSLMIPHGGAQLDETETATELPKQTPESIIAQLDKCAHVMPSDFNFRTDCLPICPGGAASRSFSAMLRDDGFTNAEHEHENSINDFLGSAHAPKCYLVPLREPARRIESWFHADTSLKFNGDDSKVVGDNTIDAWFERNFLDGKDVPQPFHDASARSKSLLEFVSDYTGFVTDGSTIHNHDQVYWSMAQRVLDEGVDGIDTAKLTMHADKTGRFFGENGVAWVDAPIVDCEARDLMIHFLCTDDLYGRYQAFFAAIQKGETLPTPIGMHADENPTVNVSYYGAPGYTLSAENRAIVNDVFFAHDMAIFRHYCMGEENQVASAPSSPLPREYQQGRVHPDHP